MLIRLIPPSPPTILYGVTFPPVLPLHDLGLNATIPAAWSSQLQILTSVLQLEPPPSIHVLDRAVGLVARVHEVIMDVSLKEFVLKFVDGRVVSVPMNSNSVRMLLSVVADVKTCCELEDQRNSMEDSACPGSAEDLPPGGCPTKSSKPQKHKRQRSLLFSLISLFVPKSLSLSPPPPPRSAPPPTPLPPLPVSGRVTPAYLPRTILVPEHPERLRERARATLVDVWRRHIVSALAPQHLPAAGYIEWTLIAWAGRARTEIESIVTVNPYEPGVSGAKMGGNRHRKTQSEGRNALDFGDRSDGYDSEQWCCRAPSPFPGVPSLEDIDRVVYPRREQVDEWGVRYVHTRSIDEVDIIAVEYNGHNDSFLGEHFAVDDDWDDREQVTLDLRRTEHHCALGIQGCTSSFDDQHLCPEDFVLDYSDGSSLGDMAFDMSRCPLVPSDVNDDEQSDDSQMSLRTPEDGEDLMASPVQLRSTQDVTRQPPFVSRVSSSRPLSRNASVQSSSAPSTHIQASRSPTSSPPPFMGVFHGNMEDDEFIASRLACLDHICASLEIVRSRARSEGWRIVRATSIGAKNGWKDAEAERSLEIKARRRAWSSGIKISAPYSTFRSAQKVWDGSSHTFSPPMCPPGLTSSSTGVPLVRGPIVPTGLSLGIPEWSSPLAMYARSANDDQTSTPSKYGGLSSCYSMETMKGKRKSRVTFADNIAKLFPVREDESEELFEPVRGDAVGFPQAMPLVETEETEYGLAEGSAGKEDDPFAFYPSRPRTRTRSMYINTPVCLASSPVLPLIRPCTPPPSCDVVVDRDVSASWNNREGRLDASALLLQPLSSLSFSSSPQSSSSSRPPLISRPPFASRRRAVSMPSLRSYSEMNETYRTSCHRKDEHCEDLSRAYASPPPEGPLVISATPAPHEHYPRYAHVRSPIPASKPKMDATILGKTSKEVVFEQAGSEFTVGIDVALGKAEEGRVIW